MGERIGWLDTARAIGIVAVVAGHVTSDRAIWAAVYHFHMPLFFMLSGMTFAPGAVRDVARRRARTLLLPYALWLALVAGADVVISAVTGGAAFLPWDRPVVALARLVLGGTFLVGPMGIFWFVTCLFIVQLVAAPIVRRPDRQILLVAVVMLGVVLLVRHWPSPWGVISVPLGLFFFLAGVLHRRNAVRLGWRATVVAVGAAALVAVSAPLDIKIAEYGTPLLSIVAAVGLCHLVLLVAQRVPPSRIVGVIGRASLVIMYVHLTIYYAVRDRLPEGVVATLAIALPITLWLALRHFAVTRALLLGERADSQTRLKTPIPR
ncbi:acyltransferase family protein [Sphingomonas radiodurans]|uniref:acyltransferase family protein n=1 Tax=Sphingomonas radiodurans TaxID=2890321 RepID=UPI001E521878|nr:acyltransferase family protein [Sphingomonas radiodurans]WBH18265.1 acyltransferase family protein [Sphingomonas radiodurans]